MFALRDLDTGLFFRNNQWTSEASLAQEFPDLEAAEKVVNERKIKNAELVILDRKRRVIEGIAIPISSQDTLA